MHVKVTQLSSTENAITWGVCVFVNIGTLNLDLKYFLGGNRSVGTSNSCQVTGN